MLCEALGALLDHSPEAPPSVLASLGVSRCPVCVPRRLGTEAAGVLWAPL